MKDRVGPSANEGIKLPWKMLSPKRGNVEKIAIHGIQIELMGIQKEQIQTAPTISKGFVKI